MSELTSGGYSVDGVLNPAAYEEDHLIPLELGGSPSSAKNLWPEPWEQTVSHPQGFAKVGTGAQTKDRIEDSLRTRVCDGRVSLASAQHMIATNWRVAFDTYIGGHVILPAVVVPRLSPGPKRTPKPTPTQPGSRVLHPGSFCSVPGELGVTTAGTPMICELDSLGLRYRWLKR